MKYNVLDLSGIMKKSKDIHAPELLATLFRLGIALVMLGFVFSIICISVRVMIGMPPGMLWAIPLAGISFGVEWLLERVSESELAIADSVWVRRGLRICGFCKCAALFAGGVWLICLAFTSKPVVAAAGGLLIVLSLVAGLIRRCRRVWQWAATRVRERHAPAVSAVARVPAPGLTFAELRSRFSRLQVYDALAYVDKDADFVSWNSEQLAQVRIAGCVGADWVCLFWGRTVRQLSSRLLTEFARCHGVALPQEYVHSAPDGVGIYRDGELLLYPESEQAEFAANYLDGLLGSRDAFERWLAEYVELGELRVVFDEAGARVVFSFDEQGQLFLLRRLMAALPWDHTMFVCDELNQAPCEYIDIDCREDLNAGGFFITHDAKEKKLLCIRCAPAELQQVCEELRELTQPGACIERPAEIAAAAGQPGQGLIRFERKLNR